MIQDYVEAIFYACQVSPLEAKEQKRTPNDVECLKVASISRVQRDIKLS
jgi:hypothetical protein